MVRPMSFPAEISALNAHALACRRGGRLLFANLSFTLAPGQVLTLRGPNGSGKTSLLRLLAGLTPLEAGHISWGDASIRPGAEDHRERLHYAGHSLALKTAFSVTDNLLFWARYLGGNIAQLAHALAVMDLTPLADMPVALLSAGQQRRVSLARLLMVPRPLWLLDEPTIALDSETLVRLSDMIKQHLDNGGMAIIATHTDTGVKGQTLDMRAYGVALPDMDADPFAEPGDALSVIEEKGL